MRNFKFLLAAAVAISAISSISAASAADLAPVFTKAPPPVVYDWTGFYIGGNIGYSWGRSSDTSRLTDGLGTTFFTSAGSSHLDGVVGGGQIGYNLQRQNWVWGLEADIQGTGEKGSRPFACGLAVPLTTADLCQRQVFTVNQFGAIAFMNPQIPVTLNQKIDWFGTLRARGGVLVTPKVLIYATGGLAYGEIATNETVGVVPAAFSSKNTNLGWTAGVGIEGVIGGNWTAKLEYLYVDLGTVSGSYLTAIPAVGGFGVGLAPAGFVTSNYSSHITDNILRVGVNYKFGPVAR
jgi:outer membrane immunogenic protein